MKKTITSAGLVVLGAATLHAQRASYAPAPGLSTKELSKPWSVGLSLRGIYDDNQFTAPSGSAQDDDAFGIEVTPSASLNWTLPQTYLGLSYAFGYRRFDSRPNREYDTIHQVDAKLNHVFNERYKIDVADTFVSAQEPGQIAAGVLIPVRTEGDNIHNMFSADFTASLTEKLSLLLGYANHFYNYDDSGRPGSYSALLDRQEHDATINLRWQMRSTSVGLLGYSYGVSDYRGSDALGLGSPFRGTDRDSDTHRVYVGADHSFNSQLNGSLRVGAQFTDYDKFNENSSSPYVDGSLSYNYRPESYASLGVRHARNATDIAALNAAGTVPTLDQETSTVYGTISHSFTGKLRGGAMAQAQFSEFEAGGFSGDSEVFFLSGVNLSYQINAYLTAEAGYNYDRLNSDLPVRSYSRNRVYVGIRASY